MKKLLLMVPLLVGACASPGPQAFEQNSITRHYPISGNVESTMACVVEYLQRAQGRTAFLPPVWNRPPGKIEVMISDTIGILYYRATATSFSLSIQSRNNPWVGSTDFYHNAVDAAVSAC